MSDKMAEAQKKYEEARAGLIQVGLQRDLLKKRPVVMPQSARETDTPTLKKCDAPTYRLARTPNQYCVKLGNWLYDHYDISGKVQIRQRLSRSYHTTDKSGTHILRFGMQSTTRAFNEGFCEYRRICQRTGVNRFTKGWAGVRQLILHEFAHVLTANDGARVRGSSHNWTFVSRYRELMALVP